MKLVSFRVERFRNVLDSGDVPVDPSVTCLVGKNESGKTNMLHALHSINPWPTHRRFEDQQYPRWLQKDHQRSGEFASAKPITVTFELSDEDDEAVQERFGEGVLLSRTWSVSLKYDGTAPGLIQADEEAACRTFEARQGTLTGALKIAGLRSELDRRLAETVPGPDGSPVASPGAQNAQAARNALEALYPQAVEVAILGFLWERRPKFFYFGDYSQIDGRTNLAPLIEALRTNTESSLGESQRTALALLRLGFATDALISTDYEKRSGEMESVEADLTRQVQRYWHQNDHLRLKIDIEPEEETRDDGQHIINRYLQLRVEDTRHYFTNNLDVRSSGFRWFISFIAAFKEFEADTSVVVLLDEPALALHARAQRDFLAFIEDTIGASHQVIYTTHSPFMIDAGRLERVRIVEDTGPDEGAVVRAQLVSQDPDSLSPLQGALGYDIAQSIFVGPDNLVVEGLSEYTYLTVMSEVLRAKGRSSLDLRWRLLPAGGAGAMPAAVSLLGQELDVTVVVDGETTPLQKLNGLAEEGLLNQTRIVILGPIVGMRAADIEDMFDPEDYLEIYNAASDATLTLASLDGDGDGEGKDDRIVARVKAAVGAYNHNDPSSWFLQNRMTATSMLRTASLDRFEQLINAINATLA